MNSAPKNKLLTLLVILLIAANAITLTMFWLGRVNHPPRPGGNPQQFLIRELKLDSIQQEKFEILIQQHREGATQLRQKIALAKESFFDLLKQPGVSDSAKLVAAKEVSSNTEALDLLTLDHFQKVRDLCTAGQQVKFDKIIHQVISMIGQPRPPVGRPNHMREPPPAGPAGDRPPSPDDQGENRSAPAQQ